MAKKRLSLALAAALLLSALSPLAIPSVSAAAVLRGDIDADGSISSADARTALRGSVGLEELTADFMTRADVDSDGELTSADARTILRASVNLETIFQSNCSHQVKKWSIVKLSNGKTATYHTGLCVVCGEPQFRNHEMTPSITVAPTCTKDGKAIEMCVCGLKGDAVVVPAQHTWEEVKGTRQEATCTKDGTVQVKCTVCGAVETQKIPKGHIPGLEPDCTTPQVCTRCGEILAPALGHIYKEGAAISITKGMRCERCGEIGVPGFNDLVNGLKDGSHTFSAVVLNTSSSEPPKRTGITDAVLGMLEGFAKQQGEDIDLTSMLNDLNFADTENSFTENQLLTKNSFNLYSKNAVSELKDSDIVSITTEEMKGIDFLKELPDTFTEGAESANSKSAKTFDLTKLKKTVIGNVRKVTVTLAPERHSELTDPENSPISRIDNMLSSMANVDMDSMMGEMDLSSEEFSDIPILGPILEASTITVDSLAEITVRYYFDSATNAPIAAAYNDSLNIQFLIETYIDDLTWKKISKKTGSLEFNIANDIDSYFFFDDYFKN